MLYCTLNKFYGKDNGMAKNILKEKIKKLKEKYPAFAEVALYLLVGLFAKIVDMTAMALVKYIAEPHLYANVIQLLITTGTPVFDSLATGIGFIVGTVVEFVLSSRFVFPKKQLGDTPLGFLVYVLISAGGLGLHVLAVYIGTSLWGFNPFLIKLAMGFVVVAYNYTVKKLILFSRKTADKRQRGTEEKTQGAEEETTVSEEEPDEK